MRGSPGRSGYQLPRPLLPPEAHIVDAHAKRFLRKKPARLPECSELDVVRHFTRLSSYNFAIDLGMFPLGSCTMKYNPRINEELAALSGLAECHPSLPREVSQGALAIVFWLEQLLASISGLAAVSCQPAAGAQGEHTGLLVIRAFHQERQSAREFVLIPESAHGTNPASCSLAGFKTREVPCSNGLVTLDAVENAIREHGNQIAAMMVTNPNTLGLFETHLPAIADRLHSIGAQLYMDGANLNAIMGVAKPSDMGVDVMQFNLHKTFSTPHGGGGPGAGPIAVRKHLAPYLPNPRIVKTDKGYFLE